MKELQAISAENYCDLQISVVHDFTVDNSEILYRSQ